MFTYRNSVGADIPMEECVAYGTHEERRGRGDTTIATSDCPAYGVGERQQGMAEDDAYENWNTLTIMLQTYKCKYMTAYECAQTCIWCSECAYVFFFFLAMYSSFTIHLLLHVLWNYTKNS